MPRVRLISYNMGAPLVILAIKTSAGKVREKGIEYYLREYPEKKQDELREWLIKAARSFPSVLEHVVFTFMIEDVSRVCTHQLVRHRIASYTQESQRYSIAVPLDLPEMETAVEKYRGVLEEDKAPLMALAKRIDEAIEGIKTLKSFFIAGRKLKDDPGAKRLYRAVMELAERFIVIPPGLTDFHKLVLAEHGLTSIREYLLMVAEGVPPEDARYMLPQSIKTRIMMTVNLRELLHIAKLRLSEKAQWEIREVVSKMVEEAEKVVPGVSELVEAYKR